MSSPESDADISTSTRKSCINLGREALQRLHLNALSPVLESSVRSDFSEREGVSPPDSSSSRAIEKDGAHGCGDSSPANRRDASGRKSLSPRPTKNKSIFSPVSESNDYLEKESFFFETSRDKITFIQSYSPGKFDISSERSNSGTGAQMASDVMVTVHHSAPVLPLGLSERCNNEMLSDLASRPTEDIVTQNHFIQINIMHSESTISFNKTSTNKVKQISEVQYDIKIVRDECPCVNPETITKMQSAPFDKRDIFDKSIEKYFSNDQEESNKVPKRKSMASKLNESPLYKKNPHDFDNSEIVQASPCLSIANSQEADIEILVDTEKNGSSENMDKDSRSFGEERVPFSRKSVISNISAGPRKDKKKSSENIMPNLNPSFCSGTDSTSPRIRRPRPVKFPVSMRAGSGGDLETTLPVQSDHLKKCRPRFLSDQLTSKPSNVSPEHQEGVPAKANETRSLSVCSTPRIGKRSASRKNVCNMRVTRKTSTSIQKES